MGAPTADPGAIPLTPLGHEQARCFARWFPAEPALIVTSSYARTGETAAPLQQRFPEARREQWPIHEFTYLSPERYAGTTPNQRRRAVVEYWNIADPQRIDGPGAESLQQLFERVRLWEDRLAALKEETVVFAHGQIMQALLFLWLTGEPPRGGEQMRRFKLFCEAIEVPNTGVIEIESGTDRRNLGGVRAPHLIAQARSQ